MLGHHRLDAGWPAQTANRVAPCHSSRTSQARSGRSRRGRRWSSVRYAAPAPSTPIRQAPGTPTSTCGPATWWAASRVWWTCSAGSTCARTSPSASSTTSPPIRTTTAWRRLAGSRVGPGFRSTVGTLFPDEVARAGSAAPAARRLGRRGAGLRLRGAARGDHAGHRGEDACGYRRPHGRHLRGLRRGRLARPVRQDATAPSRRCTDRSRRRWIADGMHGVEPLRPHGMRRFRRLDLSARRRLRRALPRLARRRRRRRDDRARVHRRGLGRRVDEDDHRRSTAEVRVLPWQECPGAIGSAVADPRE